MTDERLLKEAVGIGQRQAANAVDVYSVTLAAIDEFRLTAIAQEGGAR